MTKRRRRRGKVSETTLCALSADAWLRICANAYTCPHVVFRLMMVCRWLRDALRGVESEWWTTLFQRVCAYQNGLRHSNTLHRLRAYQEPERGLRAVFAPRCDACGARRGHRLLRPYALRLCGRCLNHGLVSNLALELLCGLSFCDFLAGYLAGGGFFLPIRAFHPWSAQALRRVAPEYDRRLANALVFFWRPDVERTLGKPLNVMAEAHTARRRAALTIAAHVRRRLRTRTKARAQTAWLPGGPRQLHTGRSRFGAERLVQWEALMHEATERIRPYLSLRWLPDAAVSSI